MGMSLIGRSADDRAFGTGLIIVGFGVASLSVLKIFVLILNKSKTAKPKGESSTEEEAIGIRLARNAEQMQAAQFELEHNLRLLGSNRIG